MEISLLGKGTALAPIRLAGCLIGILLWRRRESFLLGKTKCQEWLMGRRPEAELLNQEYSPR
jgi:hypothetical protein